MPCNYNTYPTDWLSKIRPEIMERDGHKCKKCRVPNYELVFRGIMGGKEVFQNAKGEIYEYPSGEYIKTDACAVIEPISGNPLQKAIKVVLTVAHIDGNINNNDYSNLAALCNKCHLLHDKTQHLENSRKTREKKKGLQRLFQD